MYDYLEFAHLFAMRPWSAENFNLLYQYTAAQYYGAMTIWLNELAFFPCRGYSEMTLWIHTKRQEKHWNTYVNERFPTTLWREIHAAVNTAN